ncbi:P-loop NTPase family protein [Natronospora cellulosivora (SeqCode)]
MTKFQKLLEKKKREIIAQGRKEKSQTTTKTLSGDELKKMLYQEMIIKANIPHRYSNKNFANYKVCAENKQSHAKVLEYLKKYDDVDQNGSWLVMMGDYGTGKTHLSIALLKNICSLYAIKTADEYSDFPLSIIRGKANMQPVLFVKGPELLEEIKSAYEYDDVLESDVLIKYKYKRFLVVDDLGTEKPSKWMREKLYSILDFRYSNLRPTVITTNCDFDTLVKNVGQRVVDRIQEAATNYMTGWQGDSYRINGKKDS